MERTNHQQRQASGLDRISEPTSKIAFTVPEFCSASGLGKTSIYEAIRGGVLKSVFIAGRRLIFYEDGRAWLRSGREAA